MRPRPGSIPIAMELLEQVFHQPSLPLDRRLKHYFRQHRQMGARDRGFLAELLYGCLRRRRSLTAGLGSICAENEVKTLVLAYLVKMQAYNISALAQLGLPGITAECVNAIHSVNLQQFPLAVQADLPDEFIQSLLRILAEADLLKLAEAFHSPALVDLRVNTIKASREVVAQRLAAEGISTQPTPFSPVGIRCQQRAPLIGLASFKAGLFEIQDEASQLVGYLVEPQSHQIVIDFCAGAGGKTLHLGALMQNTGSLYAFDTSKRRLSLLHPRWQRSGLRNVHCIFLTPGLDPWINQLAAQADRVLVDAPCSGTGTIRRNPDIKWRPLDLQQLVSEQKRIIALAASLVKPAGRLVYATCSLLPEENEDVVEDFLSRHSNYQRLASQDILQRQGIHLSAAMTPAGDMRLFPHQHGTDGFYAAVLVRQA